MNKINNTSNARGEPVATSTFSTRGRGMTPQTYRSTGRNGPPELIIISGVPAWLEEVGSRKKEVGSRKMEEGRWKKEVGSREMEVGSREMEAGRWKMYSRHPVRQLTDSGSVNGCAESNRLLQSADGFGMTAARRKPPAAKYDAFHRAKLPEMGKVCGNEKRLDLSACAAFRLVGTSSDNVKMVNDNVKMMNENRKGMNCLTTKFK